MSKRSPKLVEKKLEIVCLFLNQEQSLTQLSKQYQVNHQTIQSWKMNYEKCRYFDSKAVIQGMNYQERQVVLYQL